MEMFNLERIDAMLALLGITPPTKPPTTFLTGPFVFEAEFADNATTADDLTAATAIFSPSLRNTLRGTVNDPEIMLLVTGVEARFVANAETEAVMQDVIAVSTLRWTQGGRQVFIDLAPRSTTYTANGALDAQAGPTERSYSRPPILSKIDFPFVVDMNLDGFDFVPDQAVNTGAVIPVQLFIHGAAWRRQAGIYNAVDMDCGTWDKGPPGDAIQWAQQAGTRGARIAERASLMGRIMRGVSRKTSSVASPPKAKR